MSFSSQSVRTGAKRLSGFAVVPALGILGPFLLVPIVSRVAGPDGWTAVASAQAIGTVGATLVQFGWPSVGPAMVARQTASEAADLYYSSLLMRGLLLVFAAPTTVAIAWWLTPDSWRPVAALLALAATIPGMTATWFFVGRSRPGPIIWYEVGPRMLGICASGALLLYTRELWTYAIVALSVEALIALFGALVIAKRSTDHRAHFALIQELTRSQFSIAVAGIVSLGYTRAAVPLVAGVNFQSGAVFAACDRLNMLGRSLARPGVQALQGWVYAPPSMSDAFKRRASRSIVGVAIFGVLAGVVVAIVVPYVDTLIFGPEIPINQTQAALVAIALFAIWMSSSIANLALIPAGRLRLVSLSLMSAATIGIPSLIAATTRWGASGALVVVACVEIYVALMQGAGAIAVITSRKERRK